MKALEKKRAQQRKVNVLEHKKRDLLPLAELKVIEKEYNQAKMKNEYLRHQLFVINGKIDGVIKMEHRAKQKAYEIQQKKIKNQPLNQLQPGTLEYEECITKLDTYIEEKEEEIKKLMYRHWKLSESVKDIPTH